MLELFAISFFAGALTVLAPCILPVLPVVLGGSIETANKRRIWLKPMVLAGSLAVSVILFSLILKATTALLGVPQIVWRGISGGIVLLFGLTLLYPHLWEWLLIKTKLQGKDSAIMQKTSRVQPGILKDVLLGASLGPIFSSCSPTYALIVAVILPASFGQGLLYLVSYAIGLGGALLLIGLGGQAVTQKLNIISNPNGVFKRILGVIFILTGTAVLFGLDHSLQKYILDKGWYNPIIDLENKLR